MLEMTEDDVAISPTDTAFEKTLRSPTSTVSTIKDHLDTAPPPLTPIPFTPPFPEGGLQAWLTVLGGIFPSLHSCRVFAIPLLVRTLHIDPPLVVLSPDRIFMLSLVEPHHYYQNFLAQGVGMGIGMGLIFLPSLQVTSHYFRRRRSLAMGIVISEELTPFVRFKYWRLRLSDPSEQRVRKKVWIWNWCQSGCFHGHGASYHSKPDHESTASAQETWGGWEIGLQRSHYRRALDNEIDPYYASWAGLLGSLCPL
ncbi:hypothetical protein H0H93_010013 [Arthromyces matolae]|nr:hypothetical protein H0H93_010013 [Arthromyces matolae]